MSGLLENKKGLVIGVANERSIAWGIASEMHREGAEIALTYQNKQLGKRVIPLGQQLGSKLILESDVRNPTHLTHLFDEISGHWDGLDFLVHAIAFSDKSELTGRFINTSKDNFSNTLEISCYSLIELARIFAPLMPPQSSIITLSFIGSNRVTPNYNVMGVAKAALESTVKYLANDLGKDRIRVNAISPGPMKTLAGAAIGGARKTFRHTEANAPLGSNSALEHIGGTAVYLASNLSASTTGEIITVDGGFHVLGMPQSHNL